MAMFNSYVSLPEGNQQNGNWTIKHMDLWNDLAKTDIEKSWFIHNKNQI